MIEKHFVVEIPLIASSSVSGYIHPVYVFAFEVVK
jgi:hypothetical protein